MLAKIIGCKTVLLEKIYYFQVNMIKNGMINAQKFVNYKMILINFLMVIKKLYLLEARI